MAVFAPASSPATTATEAADLGASGSSSIPVSPALPASGSLSTNAVTRNLSDLHAPTWFALLSVNIAARTVLLHPIHLAIGRKRLTRESTPPSVWGLMAAAYRGGHTSAYGASSAVGRYHFGQGGVRGVYRGVGAALLGNLAGETSYLFTLEAMKEYVANGKSRGAVRSGDESTTAATAVDRAIFTASSASAAVGAMCGDLVALLLVTPLVIVCNRQMTAGYGMAAENTYSSIPRTLRTVWGLYQQNPAAAAVLSSPATPTTTGVPTAAMAAGSSPTSSMRRFHRVRRGFAGLYQGLSAGLLRIPSSGCWWALYTKSKEAVYTVAAPTLRRWEQEHLEKSAAVAAAAGGNSKLNNNNNVSTAPPSFWQQNWLFSPTDNPLLNAVAGILASASTTFIFNPIAVIQTRQQSLPPHFWAEQAPGASSATTTTAAAGAHRRSWRTALPFRRLFHVSSDLVRKEGVRAFFKGAPANMVVAVIDGILFTVLFEFTKLGSDVKFLEQRSVESAAGSDLS